MKLSFFGDFPVPLKSNVCKNRIHLQCLDGLVIKLDIPLPSVRRDQTFDLSVKKDLNTSIGRRLIDLAGKLISTGQSIVWKPWNHVRLGGRLRVPDCPRDFCGTVFGLQFQQLAKIRRGRVPGAKHEGVFSIKRVSMLRVDVRQSEGKRRRLMSPELLPFQYGFSSGRQPPRSKAVGNTKGARCIDDDIKLVPLLFSSLIAGQDQ